MLIRSKAPLRLGLAGGGTDVPPYCDLYVGYVLNATIDLYAHCTIETHNLNKITFRAEDRNQAFESDAVSFLNPDGILDLHKGIYNKIVSKFNDGKPLSFTMTTYSDAPSGSGLGGSSTMVVAMIKAFVEWLHLPLGDYDIAKLAFEIEREDIGIIGGSQDQYAATFGGFNFIEFYENKRVIVNPLRIKNWIVDELESSFVLYFTGITRSASIIEEEKSNAIRKDSVALEAMHDVKNKALLMKESILKGDIKSFAEILGHSWESKKKMAASVSNKDINHIYETAIENGAYSGKISGAGGGGFMFFIVDPIKKIKLINTLNTLGGKVINFHFTQSGTKGWLII
ncbi:MAG: dehydrogenase [Desulfobacter postgatei]|uniref:Putative kinase, galactokinase/mevalonate kinase n=1 Tax=Desulfobacter postgatei 2ac9 TaxID=879212 RepID=I5B6J0_9BACT|nr:dehydrogenase [Desulfobacter postgatei]EIM65103.1 putative kinase, galactokinase/mevalonate kinase [Desulfobacter postgatei 2ac9]MDD4274316.1 dehydrogenase [Desulfobacter postgatei]